MSNLKTLAVGATLAIASIGAFAQAAAPATPRVDQREANQEARIDAGVASGQLNARETRRLEKQQGHVDSGRDPGQGRRHRHRRPSAAISPRCRTAASANIYQQKHDAQIAPPMTPSPERASGAQSAPPRTAPRP